MFSYNICIEFKTANQNSAFLMCCFAATNPVDESTLKQTFGLNLLQAKSTLEEANPKHNILSAVSLAMSLTDKALGTTGYVLQANSYACFDLSM